MEGNNKPVILIVENGMAFTGAFKAAIQTVEDLHGKFNFIFVVPKNSKQISILEKSGITYYSLPFIELSFRVKNIILYFPLLVINSIKLLQIIKREKVQLIHSNDLYNLTVLLPKIINPKLKLITYVRLLPGYIPLKIYKWMVALHSKIADAVVCVSKAVHKNINTSKAIVIYDRPPAKERLPYHYNPVNSNGHISIIYLGNYIAGKGQNYAVEAFIEVIKKNADIRLIFAGGDMGIDKNIQYKEALKQIVKKNNLNDKVIFKDFVDLPEEELKQNQIMLNFSDSESFSFTCLEASYYGLPVIATDSGGPAEIIENNVSGIIVKKGDIKGMAEAMVLLAGNEQKRLNFSAKARHLTREKFSYEQTTGKVYELYTRLLV